MKLSLETWRHKAFVTLVVVKLIDGTFELIAGLSVYVFTKVHMLAFLRNFFNRELLEDPNDLIVNVILDFFNTMSISTQHFFGFYLLLNGLLKIFLMSFILQKKLWAYPVTMVTLVLLVGYEVIRITNTHSVALGGIIIVDCCVIYLLYSEYKRITKSMGRAPQTSF